MTQPGGFIPPSTYLPSPAPSNYSSTASRSSNVLPNQRSTPLKSGSKRESALMNYLDDALLQISRKFTKKFPTEEEKSEVAKAKSEMSTTGGEGLILGYSDVEPLIEDLEKLIGLVWVSGTDYLPQFPPRPTPTFRVFDKLDLAFHTLLSEYRMSVTEKVRLGSIVKVSRAMVVRLMEGRDFLDETEENDGTKEEQDADEDGGDSDSDLDLDKGSLDSDEGMEVDEETEGDASRLQRSYGRQRKKEVDRTERALEEEKEDEEWEIEVARVYSRVLEGLGEEIGGDPIGIVVDD
ncbi:uncharacterized protein DFL_005021 [Arthrobotrys flagrans]|uniref:Uncharacterized protein n=1 Tax=Arthrobotrys flagrans TaxID=97331 RepID=A0A437A6V2_ARTFL|nr:hypothetical protein DFL_005021 [Arthrobotrys flagrans]